MSPEERVERWFQDGSFSKSLGRGAREALVDAFRAAENDAVERLQTVLDSRPAINAGLPESYIKWSQSIYLMEYLHIAGGAQ